MGLLDELFASLGGGAPAPQPMQQPQPQAQPQRPDFSGPGIGGTDILGALLAGAGGPIGNVGKVMLANSDNERQVKGKNDTYDFFVKRGLDPDTARIAVTNPEIGKALLGQFIAPKKAPDVVRLPGEYGMEKAVVWDPRAGVFRDASSMMGGAGAAGAPQSAQEAPAPGMMVTPRQGQGPAPDGLSVSSAVAQPDRLGTGQGEDYKVGPAVPKPPAGYVHRMSPDKRGFLYGRNGQPVFESEADVKLRTEGSATDNKRLFSMQENADVARSIVTDVGRLRAARDKVSYEGGPLQSARTLAGKWLPDGPGPFGIPGIPSQEEAGQAENIGSISTEMQLRFAEKTKGAISDREMALFGSAVPGMDMSDAGAKHVMDGMEAGSLRAVERAKFYDAWRQKSGSLAGADEAWDNFTQRFPVFAEDGKGGFTINRENIGAWRGLLGGKADQSQPQQGQGQQSAQQPRQAKDGNFYVPDPNRPGKYLRVE